MSPIRHNAERETLDLKAIERGLENGRTLRSQAFTSFLKGLFVQGPGESQREDSRIGGCAAAA